MINADTGHKKVTTRPAERSSVVLEVEFPADEVQRSVAESVRHLARNTKVAGFRPGKAPRPLLERALGIQRDDPAAPNAIYDDAKEHLFETSVLEAAREQDLDLLAVPAPEWLTFSRGRRRELPRHPADPSGGEAGRIYRLPLRDHDRRDH